MIRRFSLFAVAAAFTFSACTCNRQPVAPTLKKLGEACATDDSCATGLCDAIPGTKAVCVKKCADGCAQTEICTQLTPSRFSCAADPRKLCGACQIDSDCPYPSDRCVVVNGEKVCGRDCAFDQNCPSGYSCRNALGTDGKAKLQQCTPTVASCACLARGDLSQPCSLSNSYGTCGGIKTCDLVSNTVACSAHAPAPESCNGIDDNCNGNVDEIDEMKSCGKGACERTISTCSGGVASECKPGMPIAELCNAIDDDCDGVVDNGYPVDSDPNNCGACGYKCSDHVQHASPLLCNTRVCDYGMCDPGWVDRDGDRTNGCEFRCAASDLPDTAAFADENCDGFDGELNNGIFVSSTTGDDANDGAKDRPKKTITGPAGAMASLGSKRDIYVAKGTYAGPLELNLSANMVVAGGYDPTTWQRVRDTNATVIQGGNPALRIEGATNVNVQLMKLVGNDATAVSAGLAAYGGWVKDSTGVKMEYVALVAGRGADGAAGAAGLPAQNGGLGGDGAHAKIVDNRSGAIPIVCNAVDGANVPTNGAGGSSCSYLGGSGGSPSHDNNASNVGTQTAVPPGGPGASAPQGDGAGGVGVPEATAPSAAHQGANGSSALTPGVGGAAALAGSTTSSGWATGNGKNGTAGTAGKGGGGGGGGAGGWTHLLLKNYYCQTYGSAGGGGGGGGCGGLGGEGGHGGGAAIGLFVINSSIAGAANTLSTGAAGAGGTGGAGAAGGIGGAGGNSEDPPSEVWQNTNATKGGGGGRGGDGTAGGTGSGGAGGAVFGIARNSTSSVTGFSAPGMGAAGAGGTGSVPGPTGDRSVQTTF